MTRDSTGARGRRTPRTRRGICITTASRASVVGLVCLAADAAHAYVGPGAGLSAIGTLLVLLAAVLLAIVGFVWFPVKCLVRKLKNRRKVGVESAAAVNKSAADRTASS